jgi:hypothetical protein
VIATQTVEDLKPLDAPALLDRLGYTAEEHVSVNTQLRGGIFMSRVVPSSTVGVLPTDLNVWLGVNPVRPRTTGRGTASDVTRLAALWADLDVKPGGCPDLATARQIIDALAAMLHARPVAVTFSGHGLQPFWAIEDAPLDTDAQRARARALVRRWGRLVAHVAGIHHSHVDGVFDLARVLRAPGTVNHKAAPVPVLTFADDGRPVSLDEVEEVLGEYNVVQRHGDSEDLGQVLSSPGEWAWTSSTCKYAKATTEAWLTETPSARHPWLLSAAVRLACMHRYGCITEADYGDTQRRLVERFQALLEQGRPQRQTAPGEVADAFSWGRARASAKTDEGIAAELGDHPHRDGFEDIVVTPVGQADTTTGEVLDGPGTPAAPPGGLRRMVLTSAATIKPRPVFWLWEARLALGTLALLAGREGLGKSTLGYWIAARITRGDLPGVYNGTPKAVLVCATEDSWEHTIVPRLIAADADLERVYRVEVVTAMEIHVGLSLPRDLTAMERSATEVGAAILLLDPLMSRLGDLDTHRDAEVRQALEPLAAIADRCGMAVLGLIHHNKSGSSDPLQLVMGSKAFTAVARSVHTVVPDPEDETDTRRLFGTPKNNLGRTDLPTLSFTIASHPIDTEEGSAWTGRLTWGGQHAGSIGDAMRRASVDPDDKSATTEAAEWLEDLLVSKSGSVASADVKRLGKAAGHGEQPLRRARERLGLTTRSEGFPRVTYWESPVVSQSCQSFRGDHLTNTTEHSQVSRVSRVSRDGDDTTVTPLPGFTPPTGPGRCFTCGFHTPTQGHRTGCEAAA